MRRPFTVLAIIVMLTSAAHAELPAATESAVNQAMSSGKPTLIDFGLRTCKVCKKMAPYLESLANDYRGRANILFIDVRSNQSTAQKFRVQMLPTQIFIDPHGKEVQRHAGFMDKEGLIKGLKSTGLK